MKLVPEVILVPQYALDAMAPAIARAMSELRTLYDTNEEFRSVIDRNGWDFRSVALGQIIGGMTAEVEFHVAPGAPAPRREPIDVPLAG